MNTFKDFGLSTNLVNTLEALNFNSPTPIQAKAIPFALDGSDILGSAQTGTGKTAAYGIPLVEKLTSTKSGDALIIAPTRELAMQVLAQIRLLLNRNRDYHDVLLIGGESMDKQMKQLSKHPRIIVGTPGRINDHLRRGSISLKKVNYLVLDEIDRMLDMGFSVQIEEIARHLPDDRQTLMFSATLPKAIVGMASKYLQNPIRVSVGEESKPATKVKQVMVELSEGDKYDRLLDELNEREGSIIVFVKTRRSADKLTDRLKDLAHKADAIHGDLRQSKRSRVIKDFRDKKKRILVATDVAARGLDIPHIEHVINYDLPQCAEDYIHRIGRTARAGADGEAICFVSPSDWAKWKAIDKMMNPEDYKSRSKEERAPSANRASKSRSKDRSREKFGKKKDFNAGAEKRDRGFRKDADSFSDRPRKSSSERSRSFDRSEDRPSFKKKDYSDRKKTFGSDERKSFGSDRKKPFGSDRRKAFGSDERRSFGADRKKSFGRDERGEGSFEERRGSFGDKKKRSFGADDRRKPFGDSKKKAFGKNTLFKKSDKPYKSKGFKSKHSE